MRHAATPHRCASCAGIIPRAARPAVVAAALLLAACSSTPPPNTYTLMTDALPTGAQATRDFVIQTAPVTLPPQVDQPQLMLRANGGQLAALTGDRWAAPLGDELHTSLSAALTRRLGVPDVDGVGPSAATPTWRIQTDVQRFEMPMEGAVVLDATWRIRRDRGVALLCRSVVQVLPAAAGVPGVVGAQQQAVIELADAMARAIEAGGQPPADAGNVRMMGCSRTGAAD